MSVLFVEDDVAYCQFIMRSLKSSSVFLRCVESAAEAREALKARPFDVILLDLNLKDTAGLESLRRVREGSGEVPIVVITGLDWSPRFKEQGLAQGAARWLQKVDAPPRVILSTILSTLRLADSKSKLAQVREALRTAT